MQNSGHKNIKCLQYNVKNIGRHQRAFLLSVVFFGLFFVFDVCLPSVYSRFPHLWSFWGRKCDKKKWFSINCNVWSVGFFSLIYVNWRCWAVHARANVCKFFFTFLSLKNINTNSLVMSQETPLSPWRCPQQPAASRPWLIGDIIQRLCLIICAKPPEKRGGLIVPVQTSTCILFPLQSDP